MDTSAQHELRRLVSAVLDRTASAVEVEQLEQRLLASAEARRVYLQLVDVEARLNKGDGPPASVTALTRSVSEDDARSSLTLRVGTTRPNTRSRSWLVALVIVATVLAIVALRDPWNRPTEVPQFAAQPFILRCSGDVQFKASSSDWQSIGVGQRIGPDSTLRTADEDDELVLRYEDGTEISLVGTGQLVVVESAAGGKLLDLRSGQMSAEVAPQPAGRPLIVVTPHTTLRVLGTRFTLAIGQYDGTRLELETGQVELIREAEKPVRVEANSIAIVPSATEPIQLSPRPIVRSVPQREMSFDRLRSIRFAADGQTIIGATTWQQVNWFDDERIEALPLAKNRHAASVVYQAGELLAFEERDPRRLVIWNTTTREPLAVFDQFEKLPVPDREHGQGSASPSVRSTPLHIVAMSPRGDWFATRPQDGRVHQFRLHDLKTGRFTDVENSQTWLSSFLASPDGSLLAVSHSDIGRARLNRVELISPADGSRVALLPIEKSHLHLAMAFSATGRRLAVGLDGEVQVWDVPAAELIERIEGQGFVSHVALSADGERLAAASSVGHVRCYDLTRRGQPQVLQPRRRVSDLAFSPDGKQLAILSAGRRITVWDVTAE